jgi:FlaA1/EpsC-like NDP-sugar epimerase
MESNPCEAVLDNVGGSMNMAEIARENNVKRFVMVSTDKAVNPTNVMGATKRTAEMYVQSLNSHLRTTDESCTRYVTTRFGNVLGSNGSVVPRFREQIAKGGPVTVTHPDIIRYFMTIPEACRLVLQAATMGDGGDIFVFDMGEPVKIANLARRMILLSGLQPNEDIKIVYTGLRPGEKLFEEVLTDNESTTETHHEKIRIARPCNTQFEVVAEQVHNLLAKADQFDAAGTVNALKHLVPNFISRNSPWEEFDLTAEHPALPTDVPEIRQTVV